MAARVPTFKGAVATFRTPGVAVTNQPVFTIFNATGSGVLVAVREIVFTHDRTTNSTGQRWYGTSRLTTEPTDGTLLTPIAFDTTGSHHANVKVRGLASADGTNGTLTATAASTAWRDHGSFLPAAGSLVDQMAAPFHLVLPFRGTPDEPVILAEGQGLLIYEIDAGSTSGHGVFSIAFEEFNYSGGNSVALAVASPFTASFTKSTTKTLAVASTFTASFARSVAKTLAVVAVLAPVLLAQQIFLKALAVASTFVPGLADSMIANRTLAATTTMTAIMVRQINKTLAVASPFTVGVQKRMYVTLAVASELGVGLRKGMSITLSVASSFASTLNSSYVRAQAMNATSAFSSSVGAVFRAAGGAVRRLLSMMGVGH